MTTTKISKSWKVTLVVIAVPIIMLALQAAGIDGITDTQVQNAIFLTLGISTAGVASKGIKRIAEKRRNLLDESTEIPVGSSQTKLEKDIEENRRRIEDLKNPGISPDQLEDMKNRLGLASESTTVSDVIEELERIRLKSTATQKALKLTVEDYERFGVLPSPNL